MRRRAFVADDVVAELAAGALDACVGLALGRAQRERHLRAVRASGQPIQRLLDDLHALAHLLEADEEAVVAVAPVPDGDLEVVLVVAAV